MNDTQATNATADGTVHEGEGLSRPEVATFSTWAASVATLRGIRLLRLEPGSRWAGFVLDNTGGRADDALAAYWAGESLVNPLTLSVIYRDLCEKARDAMQGRWEAGR